MIIIIDEKGTTTKIGKRIENDSPGKVSNKLVTIWTVEERISKFITILNLYFSQDYGVPGSIYLNNFVYSINFDTFNTLPGFKD